MSTTNFPSLLLYLTKFAETREELDAFKVMVEYLEQKQKYFPKTMLEKVTEDPRKTHLFRCCYKVATDVKQKLQVWQVSLYVKAQIQILKVNEDKIRPITGECLVGEKAWKRWLFWYGKYKARKNKFKPLELTLDGIERIKSEVRRNVELFKNKNWELEKMTENHLNRLFKCGILSPYYLLAHPQGKETASRMEINLALWQDSLPLDQLQNLLG